MLTCSYSSKIDAIKIRQQRDFDTIDSMLRGFIQACSEGKKGMAALLSQGAESIKTHVTIETAAVKTGISQLAADSRTVDEGVANAIGQLDNEIRNNSLAANTAPIRQQLLGSLKYPAMNERRNQVRDPDGKPFEWVFNPPQDNPNDYDDLSDAPYGPAGVPDTPNPIKVATRRQKAAARRASAAFIAWLQDPKAPLFWICGNLARARAHFSSL